MKRGDWRKRKRERSCFLGLYERRKTEKQKGPKGVGKKKGKAQKQKDEELCVLSTANSTVEEEKWPGVENNGT